MNVWLKRALRRQFHIARFNTFQYIALASGGRHLHGVHNVILTLNEVTKAPLGSHEVDLR